MADEVSESMEVCQKCGGNIGAADPSDACLCETPTLWKSRRERTAAGEALPDYEALTDDEWGSVYRDVVRDICVSAVRIPDDKLTIELFQRLVRLAVVEREHLADVGFEDFEDLNRIWAVMLQRIGREPADHLDAVFAHLPSVREDIRKQGGQAYLDGRTSFARLENERHREALDVDEHWNPL